MLFRPQSTRITLSVATAMLMLTACATSSSTLLTGIDSDAIAQSADASSKVTRSAADPVCSQFYDNAVTYSKEARKPNPGGQILASTGIGVLASVATGGLLGGLGTGVGGVAARQATSQIIRQSGGTAIAGLNSNDKIDAKIIEAADKLGCPVQLNTP